MKYSEYLGKSAFGMMGRPNALEGVGSIFNLFGRLPDYAYRDLSPKEADAVALFGDWMAISNDFRSAMGEMVEVAREEGYELPNGKKIAQQAR